MTEKASTVKVPLTEIFNIFQLKNPNIYNLVPSEDMGIHIYTSMTNMFQHFDAPTAEILDYDERMTEYRTAIASFDNGGIAMAVRLQCTDRSGDSQDWLFFAIAEGVDLGEELPDNQRYEIRPISILSGIIDADGNFNPQDNMCLKQSDTPKSTPKSRLEQDKDYFYLTALYADTVFIKCLLAEQIDTDQVAAYLQKDFIKPAKHYYAAIKDRTIEALSEQLSNAQKPAPTLPSEDWMVFAAPSMRQ